MSSEVPERCNKDGLLERWAACSEEGGASRHTRTSEASCLARAVETSLSHRRSAPDLKRVAREWGSTLPNPSAVVAAVASLREAASLQLLPDSPECGDVSQPKPPAGESGATGSEPTVPARVLRIIDRVLSEAMEGVSASLREAALVDPLTGCANRRALEEDLERAAAGANRTGLDVSVAVIDLDGLKQVNDSGGHAAGDACLCDLAGAVRSALRETDHVYRVGGDEFVVLMPFSGAEGASATMQRARAEGAPAFSWGVASLSMLADRSNVGQLLDLADASLYASRRTNRRPDRDRSVRRRVALVGSAAAAIAGIGSSVYIFQPSAHDSVIGAPAVVPTVRHKSGSTSSKTPKASPTRSVQPPVERVRHSRVSSAISEPTQTAGRAQLPVLTVSTTRTVTTLPSPVPVPVPVASRSPKPGLRTSPSPSVVSRPRPRLRARPRPRPRDRDSDRRDRDGDSCGENRRPASAWRPWFRFSRQMHLSGRSWPQRFGSSGSIYW